MSTKLELVIVRTVERLTKMVLVKILHTIQLLTCFFNSCSQTSPISNFEGWLTGVQPAFYWSCQVLLDCCAIEPCVPSSLSASDASHRWPG